MPPAPVRDAISAESASLSKAAAVAAAATAEAAAVRPAGAEAEVLFAPTAVAATGGFFMSTRVGAPNALFFTPPVAAVAPAVVAADPVALPTRFAPLDPSPLGVACAPVDAAAVEFEFAVASFLRASLSAFVSTPSLMLVADMLIACTAPGASSPGAVKAPKEGVREVVGVFRPPIELERDRADEERETELSSCDPPAPEAEAEESPSRLVPSSSGRRASSTTLRMRGSIERTMFCAREVDPKRA